MNQVGRNDSCPCGSGKKFKKCCLGKAAAQDSVVQAAQPESHDLNTINVEPPSESLMRAVSLHQSGKLEEAEAIYHSLLRNNPNDSHALHYLGLIALQQGRYPDAVELISKAIRVSPGIPAFHCNLGNAYRNLNQYDSAIAAYRKAIQLDPAFEAAHSNLGNALKDSGRLVEAIEHYRKALSLSPNFAGAYCNLGSALKDMGEMEEALAYLRKALSLRPGYLEAQGNLLFILSFYEVSNPGEYLEAARSYGKMVLAQATPCTSWHVLQLSQGAPQRLRVGLVSGDLNTHPVGYFLENSLKHLDQARVDLVAYSTSGLEDELTGRIKSYFSAWNVITGMGDEAVAQKIHADGIQVLIDLAGHTAKNRLSVFAWKPAPVQVSWLGYWASTGVPGMDYLLADPISVPESHRAHFTEAIWHLPETRVCFTPPTEPAAFLPGPLPAARNGHITFGNFNKLAKINDHVIALWGRVMQAIPTARLRLQNIGAHASSTREQLLKRLSHAGISSERVALSDMMPRDKYLEAYAEVDIILDTFPYTGGTTTCEAMWMGVPTLTLAGNSIIGLQGASFLTCVGLGDWVANSEDDYVERTLVYASDIDRLTRLRAGLRQQAQVSPLFDAPRFARQLENALFGMWQRRLDKEK